MKLSPELRDLKQQYIKKKDNLRVGTDYDWIHHVHSGEN